MKKTLSLFTLAILAAGADAAPLSPEMALQRLRENSKMTIQMPGTRATAEILTPSIVYKDKSGEPTLYVFNNDNNKGFMIVSADDVTTPLLGYSDSGSLDTSNLPPALEYWLEEYQNQIEYLRANPLLATRSEEAGRGVSLPDWEPISPKLKTKWNQDDPYNGYCPSIANYKCPTGCVATSVAQVMKYFNYPEKGQGSITYMARKLRKELSLDFSEITFEWSEMLDVYDGQANSTQRKAVATLMRAVGYAVQMDYYQESGAISGIIPGALVKYFNYDKGINHRLRNNYTSSTWAKMVYDNIKNISPVVYDGQGAGGGHSFVLDGYLSDGYFHVNWGWGGVADGYYLLDVLEPLSLGIGAGGGSYMFDQGAVFGMQPPKEGSAQSASEIVQYGSVVGKISGSGNTALLTMTLDYDSDFVGWGYQGIEDMVTFSLGAGVQNVNGGNIQYLKSTNIYNEDLDIDAMSIYPVTATTTDGSPVNLSPTFYLRDMNLSDGKYKVFSAYQISGQSWKEMVSNVGNYNYVYITKSGDSYNVESFQPMEFTAESFDLQTPLYYQRPFRISVEVKNPNQIELTRATQLALINASGQVAFIGDANLVTLEANGSSVETWDITLTSLLMNSITAPTSFYPGLYDSATGIMMYTSPTAITMEPTPANPMLGDVSVKVVGVEPDNSTGYIYYDIENSADFNIETSVTVKEGFFSDFLSAGFYSQVNNSNSYRLSDSFSLGLVILNGGETDNIVTNIVWPGANVGESYLFVILQNGSPISPRNVFARILGNNAGVESLVSDNDDITFLYDRFSSNLNVAGAKTVEAYYLNGMKAPVTVSQMGDTLNLDLSEAGKGIVVITAFGQDGQRKAIKLAL